MVKEFNVWLLEDIFVAVLVIQGNHPQSVDSEEGSEVLDEVVLFHC